jgi:hypothetical protein
MGGSDITVPIHILRTKMGYVDYPTSQPLYSWDGSGAQEVERASEPLWRAQKILPPPGFTPSNPRCSTDCALPTAPLYNCHIYSYSHIAQLRRLASTFAPYSPGLNPTVVHMGFVVVKMALQQVYVCVQMHPIAQLMSPCH